MPVKIFGAALDALDDPDRVELKLAYIEATEHGRLTAKLPLDPYDAIAPILKSRLEGIAILQGKLNIPGWLTPRPPKGCKKFITTARYSHFIDNNLIASPILDCHRFIKNKIFPDTPCMIAVDHAMTAAPVIALCERYGPESVAVVVLDSHFDAIPSNFRAPQGIDAPECGIKNCGSFLYSLIYDKIIDPKNLLVVGVADHPRANSQNAYNELYNRFIDLGVTIITNESTGKSLARKLVDNLKNIQAKYLYVSLDADVGAFESMNAVRFMDHRGLDEKTIIGIAEVLKALIDSGKFILAGMDVAEVDVHLLGLTGLDGSPDKTEIVCADFITTLLGGKK